VAGVCFVATCPEGLCVCAHSLSQRSGVIAEGRNVARLRTLEKNLPHTPAEQVADTARHRNAA